MCSVVLLVDWIVQYYKSKMATVAVLDLWLITLAGIDTY